MVSKFLDGQELDVNNEEIFTKTCLCDAIFDDFLARQVRLVTNEQLVYSFRCISVNFLKPLLDICEGVCAEKAEVL